MGTLTANFAKVGAVLAISTVALAGCTSANQVAGPESSASGGGSEGKVQASSAESAAAFANLFFAELIAEDPTDYSTLTPPVELTDAQAEQLILDGKVDGVDDAKLEELVDFLYENQPLGKYIYFEDGAPIQERLQTISALLLAQGYASTLETETPEKITADDVTLNESGANPKATFTTDGSVLAPALVFVNGEWKVDGKELLNSLIAAGESAESNGGAVPETPAEPAPETPGETAPAE